MTDETKRYIAVGGISVLAGLAIAFMTIGLRIGFKPAVDLVIHHFHPGDTPVVIAGGSISALAPVQGWDRRVQNQKYTTVMTNSGISYVTFSGFSPTPPNITPSNTPNSWKINIADKDHTGQIKNDAVSICSGQSECSIGGPPDPDGILLLKAGVGRRWYEDSTGVLHFHSNDCDGSGNNDNGTKSVCNRIVKITIVTTTATPAGTTYVCPEDRDCLITVGSTPP